MSVRNIDKGFYDVSGGSQSVQHTITGFWTDAQSLTQSNSVTLTFNVVGNVVSLFQ